MNLIYKQFRENLYLIKKQEVLRNLNITILKQYKKNDLKIKNKNFKNNNNMNIN